MVILGGRNLPILYSATFRTFMMNKLLILCIFVTLFLQGCGTADVYRDLNTGMYKVSAQYGILNGSWERASRDATEKAMAYCASMDKKYHFISEEKNGIQGWSPQQSIITFECM